MTTLDRFLYVLGGVMIMLALNQWADHRMIVGCISAAFAAISIAVAD